MVGSLPELGSGLCSSCESGLGLGLDKEDMLGEETCASGVTSGPLGVSGLSSWSVAKAQYDTGERFLSLFYWEQGWDLRKLLSELRGCWRMKRWILMWAATDSCK